MKPVTFNLQPETALDAIAIALCILWALSLASSLWPKPRPPRRDYRQIDGQALRQAKRNRQRKRTK